MVLGNAINVDRARTHSYFAIYASLGSGYYYINPIDRLLYSECNRIPIIHKGHILRNLIGRIN